MKQPIIERFCWFDTVGIKEGSRETIWKYKRAKEGYKLVLVEAKISLNSGQTDLVHLQVYDGHTYSHWGSFPGIYDQSTLCLSELHRYQTNDIQNLHHWECKEVTLSCRNSSSSIAFNIAVILYFYETPMSKEETFEYATKQPRYKYRHGGPRTADIEEGGGYG